MWFRGMQLFLIEYWDIQTWCSTLTLVTLIEQRLAGIVFILKLNVDYAFIINTADA